jgi:PhnB protein
VKANAYLNFDGNCAEAFRFYEKALGGKELHIMTHGDMNPNAPAEGRDTVLHVHLMLGETEIMASDAPPSGYTKPQGLHVALNVDSPADADRVFNALAAGGQITMPIDETFFAHRFGMVVDRFGTPWMIVAAKPMN